MAVQRSRERGVQVKGTAVQRPFEGNDQGALGGQGVGQSRRRKMEEEGRGFRRRETQKGF